MDPNIQKQVMEEGLKWLRATGDFVAEQAPLVCREMVAWGWWTSLICIIVGVLLLPVAVWLLRRCFKIDLAKDDEPVVIATVLGCMAASVISACLIGFNLATFIQVSVAPRLYLLEQFGRLLK